MNFYLKCRFFCRQFERFRRFRPWRIWHSITHPVGIGQERSRQHWKILSKVIAGRIGNRNCWTVRTPQENCTFCLESLRRQFDVWCRQTGQRFGHWIQGGYCVSILWGQFYPLLFYYNIAKHVMNFRIKMTLIVRNSWFSWTKKLETWFWLSEVHFHWQTSSLILFVTRKNLWVINIVINHFIKVYSL